MAESMNPIKQAPPKSDPDDWEMVAYHTFLRSMDAGMNYRAALVEVVKAVDSYRKTKF
jgi:hypothetical protein